MGNVKTRIVYYDAIKILGIYLVVIYHFNNLNINILEKSNLETYINYFFLGISSMAVPLFFMVNGALLLNKSYQLRNHLQKTLRLYGLMFLWSLISLVIFIFIKGYTYSIKDFVKALVNFSEQGVNNHLWFLGTLVAIYLIFPVIKNIYDSPQQKLLYFFTLLIFLFSFGNLFLNTVVNFIEFALGVNYLVGDSFNFLPCSYLINPFGGYYYSIVYFILGGVIAKNISNSKINISQYILIIVFLIALSLLFCYGVIMTKSDRTLYDTVWSGYYSIMTLVMAITTFIFFAQKKYPHDKVNNYIIVIGTNTLGIYLIHRFVGELTIKPWSHLIVYNTLLSDMVYGFFVVLTSLFITLIIKKVPIVGKIIEI